MDMPQQQVPIAFSQMLEMFPNIPHDVIWMYVQRYSNDIEMCAQRLTLLCQKCAEQQSPPVIKNSTPVNKFALSPLDLRISSNINDTNSVQRLSFVNVPTNNVLNENLIDNDQTVFQNETVISNNQNADSPNNGWSTNLNRNVPPTLNVQKSLPLLVNVYDDEDCIHSWRPNLSVGSLSSDFFMPSPVENFSFNANQLSNLATNHSSKDAANPTGYVQGERRFQEHFPSLFYGHPSQKMHDIDFNKYLHIQKSQMNDIRYEVIKSKIELGEVKESFEKMLNEFKEMEESKSEVQDIEKLNDEIVQLRLECQCLCTEVDYHLKDQVLLGEVDEQCYSKSPPPTSSMAESENPESHCQHSRHGSTNNNEAHEIGKWQCPKCTFDNHPAISVCEMCQLKRPKSGKRPPYLRTPPEECFCHPKTESLSIQS